jgi:hypothetical protein
VSKRSAGAAISARCSAIECVEDRPVHHLAVAPFPSSSQLQRAAEERRVGWRASMLLNRRFTGVWIRTGIVAVLFGVVALPLAFAR